MANHECSFCKKVFNNSRNLVYHQANARYCLELQNQVDTYVAIECQHCHKHFSTHQNLQYHITHRCRVKEQADIEHKHQQELLVLQTQLKEDEHKHQQDLLVLQTRLNETEQKLQHDTAVLQTRLSETEHKYQAELKEKISIIEALQSVVHSKDIQIARLEGISENVEQNRDKLQDTIADIAKQPKTNHTNHTNHNNTTNQNIILNALDLEDTEHMNTVLKKHMTKEVLYKGQEGVAMLVDKNLLRDEDGNHKYKCTDVSRQRFEYMNKEGDVVTDHKANKLINCLTTAKLCKTFHDAASEYYYKENGAINDEEMLRLQEPVHEVMNIQKDSTKFRSKLSVLTAK